MIALVDWNEDLYETEAPCRSQPPRSERLFRATRQERSSRQKQADTARHRRRAASVNGAHRRRLSKSYAF